METIGNTQRSHFINLFQIALADNEIDPAELNFLYELGIQRGFSKEQIDEVIATPEKANFEKPNSLIESIEQLYELIQMVWKDGKVHPHEIELCKSFAKRFEIREEIIDELIQKLIDEVRAGVSKEKLIGEIQQIL